MVCKTSTKSPTLLLNRSHPLRLHLADYRVRCISGNDLGVVQHVELLCGVTAGVQHNGLLASRVVSEEVSHIEDLSINDNPNIVLFRVLRNLSGGVFARSCFARWCGGCGRL